MAELQVARQADLGAHVKSTWREVHDIASLKAEIYALLPHQVTPVDITSDFTWNGVQATLNLTARTSAVARWAVISFYIDRDGGDVIAPMVFRTVGGSVDLIRLCSDRHVINETDTSNFYSRAGQVAWIPLDANQEVDYIAPAAWSTRKVFLLGYSG